ncbi:BQ2448_96 [Microbotryum intermedium]|uniref:BQ2448_96 protein n=1 Tax=Microbotryum intermedium TaxID=269621 RepID=A0A238F4K9_9BASI|nr:BQ2448_96 [Microbotryum intermedium]
MLAVQILSLLAVALPALAHSGSPRRLRSARSSQTGSEDLAIRNFDEAYAAVGLTRRDFEVHNSALSKRSQPRIRCTVNSCISQARADALCVREYRNKVSYPSDDATVTCDQVCKIACNSGFTQQDTEKSTVCIKNVDKCAGKKCATSTNGVSGCKDGECSLVCTTRGYTLNRAQDECIAFGSDPDNCETEGNKCMDSYDGRYKATCDSGKCSLGESCFQTLQFQQRCRSTNVLRESPLSACPSGFKAGTNKRRQSTCVAA